MSNTPITPQQPDSVITRDNELLFYIDPVMGDLKIKDWKGNQDLASNYINTTNGGGGADIFPAVRGYNICC
jgi:hypothetical protein